MNASNRHLIKYWFYCLIHLISCLELNDYRLKVHRLLYND